MLVWDNQQETSWFVGILEGEGSCCKDIKGRCRINVTNTYKDIIDLCVRFLQNNSIHYSITEQQPRIARYRKIYNIVVQGINECNILIKTIQDKFQCRYQDFINKLDLGSSTTTREITLTSDLYWLIGIFEAEGSFGLTRDHEKHLYPEISIKNINKRIIGKIALTLYSLGLSYHINGYKSDNPMHSEIFTIKIRGMSRCHGFFRKMKDLWRSFHYANRANLILEFLDSRFSKHQKESYSDREHQIYETLKLKI